MKPTHLLAQVGLHQVALGQLVLQPLAQRQILRPDGQADAVELVLHLLLTQRIHPAVRTLILASRQLSRSFRRSGALSSQSEFTSWFVIVVVISRCVGIGYSTGRLFHLLLVVKHTNKKLTSALDRVARHTEADPATDKERKRAPTKCDGRCIRAHDIERNSQKDNCFDESRVMRYFFLVIIHPQLSSSFIYLLLDTQQHYRVHVGVKTKGKE